MKSFIVSSNISLLVCTQVIKKLMKNRQSVKSSNETGGVLLGHETGKQITVTNIYTDQTSKRSMFSFVRSHKKSQKVIDRYYSKTNGIVNYIGEWHTHFEFHPKASNTDLRSLRKIYNDNKQKFERIFMLIIGIDGEISCYMIDESGSVKLEELT